MPVGTPYLNTGTFASVCVSRNLNKLLSPHAVVFVGFERDSYTCTESDPGSCEVCVSLLSFSRLDDSLSLSLFLATISETAEGECVFN